MTKARRVRVLLAAAIAFVPAVITLPAAASSGTLVITSSTVLTEDHQGPVVIGADGITLDCADHTISGPGDVGIDLSGRTNVTVKNCTVTGFAGTAFLLANSSQDTLISNVSTSNTGTGFIVVSGATGNTLTNNVSKSNGGNGFTADAANGNTFKGNQAAGNGTALFSPRAQAATPTLETSRLTTQERASS